MRIIRARLKPYGKATEFISIKGRIKSLILKNIGDEFNFVIEDNNRKSVVEFGPENLNKDLLGKKIQIIDNTLYAYFKEDGTIEILDSANEGALPRKETVDQLNKIRKSTKGIDIGDRISDMNKQGANIQYIKNPIDTGIESYEDFEKRNRKFVPSWNLKHIDPFGKKINDK